MSEEDTKAHPVAELVTDEPNVETAPTSLAHPLWYSVADFGPGSFAHRFSDLRVVSAGSIQWVDFDTAEKTRELSDTIQRLRREVEDKTAAIQTEKLGGKRKEEAIAALEKKLEELAQQERLGFLLTRVSAQAHSKLLGSEQFQKQFLESRECTVFVMSVDIRRSTELMLKARSPDLFATFTTTLCRDLESIIKTNFGVFDKFTGDGILAFFPDFYSGKDSGYWVIKAAHACHDAFRARYKEFRSSFTTVLTNVGLGIGIDHGPAHLVQMAGGLTVVGAPVVYACRMGGAPAGMTLLNQPAYEQISRQFSHYCFLRETELDFKHEGSTLAYAVELSKVAYDPAKPDWAN